MKSILQKFYAITDRKQFKRPFEEQIKRQLQKGIRMFQLREKDLPAQEIYNYAILMRELLRGYDAYLFINDRVDIAVMVHAEGVHLPSNGLPVEAVKHSFPELIVGKSCHSIEEAIEAEKQGADYIFFSPIFETPNKGKPKGLEELKKVVSSVNIPVYALGGISEDKIKQVLDTGVYGIAGIRVFID